MEKHLIIGNLTREPEMRQVNTAAGMKAVCSFTVAVNHRGKTDDASFYRISAWEKLGELCMQYLHKSSKVYVEGERMTGHAYKSHDGEEQISLDLTASSVEFLSPKRGDADDGGRAAMVPEKKPEPQQTFMTVPADDLPF